MIKNCYVLEVKVDERSYQFQCSPDSPLGEIHDALHQMESYIIQKMMEVEKNDAIQE